MAEFTLPYFLNLPSQSLVPTKQAGGVELRILVIIQLPPINFSNPKDTEYTIF